MSLKISRILHAGYIFEHLETQIVFDPIFENPFSKNCFAFPDVKFDREQIKKLKFDAVFISHFHDDHCSLESLDLLTRNTPIYIYCIYDELAAMISELGFEQVYRLNIDNSVTLGSFEITPRRALDADVDSMFQIRAGGLNVLNVVDSWIDVSTLSKLEESGPWDMVLWPFQTMREIEVLAPSRAVVAPTELPKEWVEQLKILNPRYVVPSSCQFIQESWSWYNHALFPISYVQFKTQVEAALPNASVVRLNPSVSIVLHKNSIEYSSTLKWIQPIGEQNVDYEYRPEIKPPTTAQISREFPKLSEVQAERVFSYCRIGLIEKYNSMDAPQEVYFQKSRLWRLAVYDQEGNSTDFYYDIHCGSISLALETWGAVSWLTEIPIFKLYGALENGEALTSLYMRINDTIFEPHIEVEIATVDITEDPLIRCLFNGLFGAYQMAQLKRLLAREML